MRTMRREWFIVLVTLAGTTGASAQGPRADLARTVFTPGRLVRLRVDARRLEGRIVSLADSQVSLGLGAGVERIVLAEMDTIWTAKRAIAQGAVIGGAIGGLAVGALAVALVRGFCESAKGCSEDYVPAFATGGAMGAAGGAALGAGLGALVRRWERAWP